MQTKINYDCLLFYLTNIQKEREKRKREKENIHYNSTHIIIFNKL